MEAGALRKTVIGTPYYLAPEVLKDSGYDFKADIWAVGISAIEMAEKDPPYADLHPMRVLYVLANNPSPKLTHEEHWSPEFNAFVKACLENNPDKRPFAKELLNHPFLRKANPAKLEPLIQSATDLIVKHGGIEKALEASRPKQEEEDETEQDAVDRDLNEDMLAGSGALLTLDSPGSTAGTSLAIGSSDDEDGTDSFFDDFTSELDDDDEDELDIDDMLAELGDEESTAKVASRKAAAAASLNNSNSLNLNLNLTQNQPNSSTSSSLTQQQPQSARNTASSIPKISTTSVPSTSSGPSATGASHGGAMKELDIAGLLDARKAAESNPTTPHKSSRTPRTRRDDANKLKIQMGAKGQIFGAPAPLMTARAHAAASGHETPVSAHSKSSIVAEIDWEGLERDAKEEAAELEKRKREKEELQKLEAEALAAAAESLTSLPSNTTSSTAANGSGASTSQSNNQNSISNASSSSGTRPAPLQKAASSIDWAKQMQQVQSDIRAARGAMQGTHKQHVRGSGTSPSSNQPGTPSNTSDTSSNTSSTPIANPTATGVGHRLSSPTNARPLTPNPSTSGNYEDLLAELDIMRSGTPERQQQGANSGFTPMSITMLVARAFDREFPSAQSTSIRGEWIGHVTPAPNNGIAALPFRNNPQFVLNIQEPTQILVTLRQVKSNKSAQSIATRAEISAQLAAGGKDSKTGKNDAENSQEKSKNSSTSISSSSSPHAPISIHIFRVRNITHAFTELPAYGAVIETERASDRQVGNAGLLEEAADVRYVVVPVIHDLSLGESVEFEVEIKYANKGAHASLSKVPTLETKIVRGSWTEKNCGGSAAYASWRQNPQFHLRVHKAMDVHLYLTQHMHAGNVEHLGWYIVRSDDGRPVMRLSQSRLMNNDFKFRKRSEISSGRLQLAPGSYLVIPCTYEPGKLGSFTLTAQVHTAAHIDFELVEQPFSRLFNNKWTNDSAGGCLNHPTWIKNPKYSLVVPRPTQLTFILSVPASSSSSSSTSSSLAHAIGLTTPRSARSQSLAPTPNSGTSSGANAPAAAAEDPFIGFYLFKGVKINAARLSRKDLVGRTKHFTDAREVIETVRLEPGAYILVPCTYLPHILSPFNVQIHADGDLDSVAQIEEASIVLDGEWRCSAPPITAGGNFSHPTWRLNPQYLVTSSSDTPVVVTLEQAATHASAPKSQNANQTNEELPFISVAVIRPSATTVHASISPTGATENTSAVVSHTGAIQVNKKLFHIRPSDVVHLSHFSNVWRQNSIPILVSQNNPLVLLPMTMVPNTERTFKISVNSNDVKVERLPDDLYVKIVPGEWSRSLNTAGGCMNNRDTWLNNPKYRFATKKAGLFHFVLQQIPDNAKAAPTTSSSSSATSTVTSTTSSSASTATSAVSIPPGGFYVFQCPNPQSPSFTRQDFVGKSEFASSKEVRAQFHLEVGVYSLILTKFEPGREGKFSLHMFAPHPEFAIGLMK